jgi:hypothetical protein
MLRRRSLACVRAVALSAAALVVAVSSAAADPPVAKPAEAAPEKGDVVKLFDGKSLAGWKTSEFGGDGKCEVKNGTLVIGRGVDLTGLRTDRALPKMNYEVTLSAQRVEGNDFFCGLTFPVREDHCSLILGGWGGGVCGLSSIDQMDASENETTTFRSFKNGQWYRIRVRVTEKKIEAWIDDKQIVEQLLEDRKISVRAEVEPSKPFGLATWQTTAAIKDLEVRKLPAPAKSEPQPKSKP